MESRQDLSAGASPALARFLERVHKSFSHDLGAPLGSIVNYACVLESGRATHAGEPADTNGQPQVGGAPSLEVRELGRRIRTNALRAARMIQLLASATRLASRPLQPASTDVLTLARTVLSDTGGRGLVSSVAKPGGTLVDVDAELIGFVWRAYVAVENDARGKPVDEATLQVIGEDEYLMVEMRCSGDGSVPVQSSDLTDFMHQNGGPARLETSMGFGLAEDLVLSHGGDFEVCGRPGISSVLRLRFPVTA